MKFILKPIIRSALGAVTSSRGGIRPSFLTGLAPNTTYHYRLVATNSAGITNGSDMTFMTLRAPLPWLMLLLGD